MRANETKQAGTALEPANETAGALAQPIDPARVVEQVALKGDLKALTPAERVQYFQAVCDSVGLNPLTRPFDFLDTRDGRQILYANKNCTDQLRFIHHISISDPVLTAKDGCYVATIHAIMPNGTRDTDVGVVAMPRNADECANAIKKAITQAKRRVTLSICGLSVLDTTEVEQVPGAVRASVDFGTGEVKHLAAPVHDVDGDYRDDDPEREKRRLFVAAKNVADQASGDAFAFDLAHAVEVGDVRLNGTSHFALWGDYTDACNRLKIAARKALKTGSAIAPTTDIPVAKQPELEPEPAFAEEPAPATVEEDAEERAMHDAELEG